MVIGAFGSYRRPSWPDLFTCRSAKSLCVWQLISILNYFSVYKAKQQLVSCLSKQWEKRELFILNIYRCKITCSPWLKLKDENQKWTKTCDISFCWTLGLKDLKVCLWCVSLFSKFYILNLFSGPHWWKGVKWHCKCCSTNEYLRGDVQELTVETVCQGWNNSKKQKKQTWWQIQA